MNTGFWAPGFWRAGFWRDGFWAQVIVALTPITAVGSGGNLSPTMQGGVEL